MPLDKTENKAVKEVVLDKEKYVLNKLLPEYVSLYRIELNSGKYEILRLVANTNARQIAEKNPHPFVNFDEYTKKYVDSFILEENKEEFLKWHSCRNLKAALNDTEKITYYYHSVSRTGKHSYYEAYAVKGKVDEEQFSIFLGYRNIDSILYKERETQEKLRKALEEARLGNEIIAAIAKTYQYISRIDIKADYFEEIANRDTDHLKFVNSGVLSSNNKKVCRELVAEEYQEAFFRFSDIFTLPERMRNEESIAMEYKMKDGSWHKLRFIEKKRDENGNLTHVLCVIRSISDSKRKEQILIDQVAEAKQDAAMKTRFLSNMSHDIRTPMNGIIGMLDLANHYPDDLQMQQKCRDKIMESSRYLVSLVNDILDITKLDTGELIEQELSFDLTEVLNKINTNSQRKALDKGVSYVVDWNRAQLSEIYLTGNPIFLERLLNIVADNAVKFTDSGGSVQVWCGQKFADEKKIVYEFGCPDNGQGMSEEFVEHAFELFSQENKTSRSTYEGSGLGLALAKKLADRMGGTIEIKSRKGVGTTVITTVPFKIGEEKKTIIAPSYDEIKVVGLHALVAEDNELNMEIVSFMLENNGIHVDEAANGLEAVTKFKESAPGYYDVVLMDIMMPELNGWDATREIRSMKRADADSIPIIAMSANAFAEDIINSRFSGMNTHLSKPLEEKKLLKVLRESVGKRREKL